MYVIHEKKARLQVIFAYVSSVASAKKEKKRKQQILQKWLCYYKNELHMMLDSYPLLDHLIY